MIYKTSEEDLKSFESLCNKWMDKFGLKSFSTRFTHKGHGSYAGANTNVTARSVAFNLDTRWPVPVTPEMLERCAIHEVIHVLMASLLENVELAGKMAVEQHIPFTDLLGPMVGKEEEGIVMTLENILIDMMNDRLPVYVSGNTWSTNKP